MTRAKYNQGKNNPNYRRKAPNSKGGRKIHEGYWLVWQPNHPLAQKNHYILEHRLVMMNHLGRLLERGELIHHKNHNKLDNRIENLEIKTWAEHSSYHNKGKIKSEEHKKKISLGMKGLHRSPQTEFKKGYTYLMGSEHKRKIGIKSRERMKKVFIDRDERGRIISWHA